MSEELVCAVIDPELFLGVFRFHYEKWSVGTGAVVLRVPGACGNRQVRLEHDV